MALFNIIGSIFQPSDTRPNYAPVHYSPKGNSSGRTQKGKLSKSDIGTPNNFKHITHIGFTSMSGLDLDSNADLKALISLAGVQEEHPESNRIFDALKEGSTERVQKMPQRMASVERSDTRSRLRSLSSTSITTSKKRKSPTKKSSHAAKVATALPDHTLLNIQSLSKVPSSNHVPSVRVPQSMPPYLKELSQTLSCNPAFHPPLKDAPVIPPRPQSLYGRSSKNTIPHPIPYNKDTPSAMARCSLPSPNQNIETGFLLQSHHLSQFERDFTASVSPSIPSRKSPVKKYAQVPALPVCPTFGKGVNAETVITPFACLEPPLSIEFAHGTVPPAPSLPLNLQLVSKKALQSLNAHSCKSLDLPLNDQVEILDDTVAKKPPASSRLLSPQKEQTLLLDQIRQGVQLKSISQNLKEDSPECSSMVGALRAVIQKRHKAIHSSDDEDEVEDDWED